MPSYRHFSPGNWGNPEKSPFVSVSVAIAEATNCSLPNAPKPSVWEKKPPNSAGTFRIAFVQDCLRKVSKRGRHRLTRELNEGIPAWERIDALTAGTVGHAVNRTSAEVGTRKCM